MNHSSPTEPWSGTDHPDDHPDFELLADLAEDLTDPEQAAGLRAHLAGCPECTDTLAALAEVRELLGAVPPPELPAELAERIDAALAAEAAAPLVLPSGRTEGRARQRARWPRRPRVSRRVLVGTAVAVLGLGLFGGLLQSLPTDRDATTAASGAGAGKPDAAVSGVDSTRPRFTDEALAAQVRQLVGGQGPAISAGKGSLATQPPEAPGSGDDGSRPPSTASPEAAGSPSCPGLPSGRPLAQGAGVYGQEQVTALVFPLGTDRYDTYLVTPDCRTLLHRTVPAV